MENNYSINGKFYDNDNGDLLYKKNDLEFSISNTSGKADAWNAIINRCNGENSYLKIIKDSTIPEDDIKDMLTGLVQSSLGYINNSGQDYVSGIEAILIIEDIQAEILYNTVYKNKFWEALKNPSNVPINVYHGMAIENHHFLSRESWFDSPVLSFQGSTKVRKIMNEFYIEEHRHDELVLLGLNTIGINQDDIDETLPLPETLALCHSLAYWAANDPFFFFTTMGILEGKDIQEDSYILAMESSGIVSQKFIEPIKNHAQININAEHGILTREIFNEIQVVRKDQLVDMIANTKLFIELYDNFHSAVWNYYSDNKNPLLRRLSNI